jgi:hypothetical protein
MVPSIQRVEGAVCPAKRGRAAPSRGWARRVTKFLGRGQLPGSGDVHYEEQLGRFPTPPNVRRLVHWCRHGVRLPDVREVR